MTLNNYLEGLLKAFKERNKTIGKFIQSTAMSTLIGVVLGGLVRLFGASGLSMTIKKGFD